MKRQPITRETKKAVWDKCSGHCWYCGKKVNPFFMHYDHVYPHSKGGDDSINNLVVSCPSCNFSKSDLSITEWRLKIGRNLGLALSKGFIKQLEQNGIDVLDDVYTWEPPVLFYFEKNMPEDKLFGDARNVKFVKFQGWSE